MTTNRQTSGGRLFRTFAPRSWARPPGLAMLALALFGLVQTGCRSGGCSNCNLGSKISTGFSNGVNGISNGVQSLAARVTRHFDGCGGGADCGCDSGGETVVDAGIPVIPGGMVYPAPGTIIPAPSMEQPPTQLEPIQSNSSAQPMSGKAPVNRSTPSGGTNASSYTAVAPKGTIAQRRGADVNRAMLSTPDASGSTDVLDNLPPVGLPSEVTNSASKAPLPAAASTTPAAPPPAATTPAANPAPAPAQNANTNTPPTAEKVSAAEGGIGILPPIETPALFQAPGIRHHASVAPTISGGSAPTIAGLDWLQERGCRTLIDLRKPSEVDSNFVEAVNDRNMVYISLPIVANRLDSSRLARFDDLINQSENRPLFFCDTDGTRAGLAWYIHLRVVGQEDSQSATGKAEEIGLTDAEVKLAEAYLATNKPKPRAATARVAVVTPTDPKPEPPPVAAPAPVVPGPTPAAEAAKSALPGGSAPAPTGLDAAPAPSTDPSPSMLPGEDRPQASNNRFRDPASWRPVAALVLTGIGVPLAYWSRSAFSSSRSTRARASLPGSVLPPSETPGGLDA